MKIIKKLKKQVFDENFEAAMKHCFYGAGSFFVRRSFMQEYTIWGRESFGRAFEFKKCEISRQRRRDSEGTRINGTASGDFRPIALSLPFGFFRFSARRFLPENIHFPIFLIAHSFFVVLKKKLYQTKHHTF